MKKHNILAGLFLLLSLTTFGQDLAGRKIINGSLSANIISGSGQTITAFGGSLLYGKIKNDNTYWAYGGSINVLSNIEESPNMVMVGPAIERGKFVKIIDKLYLAPYIGGSVKGVFGDINGFNVNAYASPLRFMYHITNQFMVSAGFGSASLQFNRLERTTVVNLNGSLTNNTNFGVFYTFK
ncbi:hypothetical protein [Emticicia sp. W12TSBA100-4]|uniref:hypothetical protein n=1 Tax=Emticicia sp. W12TSBA100-4 TaxID=3160965 RepID=UPI0033059F70